MENGDKLTSGEELTRAEKSRAVRRGERRGEEERRGEKRREEERRDEKR